MVLTSSSQPADVGCFIGDPGDDSANVSITDSTAVSYSIVGVVTSCGGGGGGGEDGPSGPSHVTSSGLPPTLPPGTGVWQGTDGSETPVEVSSPGVGQARCSAPGLQAVNVGVTVAGPVPGSIPAGEGTPTPAERSTPAIVALLALAGLAGAAALRRTAPAGA